MSYNIVKHYEFTGLEQRGSEITRPATVAAEILNAQITLRDEIEKRKGQQYVTAGTDRGIAVGAVAFSKLETSGAASVENLIFGDKIYRLKEGTVTITRTDAGAYGSAYVRNYIDSGTFYIEIVEDSVVVFSLDLGKGYDEAGIKTLANLETAIEAIVTPTYSVTIVGDNTTPAAFLLKEGITPLESNVAVLSYFYEEEVWQPTGSTNPFAGLLAVKNEDYYHPVSTLEYNRLLYISTGYDSLKKYDGVTVYRAGLPIGITPSLAEDGTGDFPEFGVHKYAITYVQYDAMGNFHEGQISPTASVTVDPAGQVNVTVTNILNTTGFNTDCAIVAGAQTAVTTITVDDGSGGAGSLKVGQTAYFYDSVSASFVERVITVVSATQITISGAAVTVADNAVISANLRIGLWRTVADGTLLYLVKEIPNNSYAATQSYADIIPDASLGAEYEYPTVDKELPPIFHYLTSYKDVVIGANVSGAPTTIQFSDSGDPEAWPSTNQIPIISSSNSVITGAVGGNQFLWVFKDNISHRIAGEISAGTYALEICSHDVGCIAHSTIQRVNNGFMWASKDSVYSSINESLPEDIGLPIFKIFENTDYSFRQMTSIVDGLNKHVLFFLPLISTFGGNDYANSRSAILVFNYQRGEWYVWDSINAFGGFICYDDNLFFIERGFSSYDSTLKYRVSKRLNNNNETDYADAVTPITTLYKPGWEHLGEAGVIKEFPRFRAFAGSDLVSDDFNITVNFEINYSNNFNKASVLFDFGSVGGDGFGEDTWSVFAWGLPTETVIKEVTLPQMAVRSIRPSFVHEEMEKGITLSGWEFEAIAPYNPAMQTYPTR